MNNNKENALIIAYNDLNNSGVPNLIYQTIVSLIDNFDFDIVVFGGNLYYYDKLNKNNITCNIIKITDVPPANKFKRLLWNFFIKPKSHYKKILNITKNKKYLVVHSFKEYESWPFLKACKENGVKKRILHSAVMHDQKRHGIIKVLEKRNKKRSFKYSNEFVGVSNVCCESAFGKKPFKVIYNAYNKDIFNMNIKNKLSSDELVVTQLATFSSNKNQLFSLAMMKELKQIYPNSHLKLIGEEREKGYLNKMSSFIAKNGLSDCVSIIDGSNGIKDNFQYTTFTILPSIREGAGITAVESQACGIKVFASTGVTKEMDVGGITFLSLKDNPKKWAEQIKKEFLKSGNNRFKYDMRRFSCDKYKEDIKKLYMTDN